MLGSLASTDYCLSGSSEARLSHSFEVVRELDRVASVSEITCWDHGGRANRVSFSEGTGIADAMAVLEFDLDATARFMIVFHPTIANVRTNVNLSIARHEDGVRVDGQLYMAHLLDNADSPTEVLDDLAALLLVIARCLDADYLAVCDEDDMSALLPSGLRLPSLMGVVRRHVLNGTEAAFQREGGVIIDPGEGAFLVVWTAASAALARGTIPSRAASEVLRPCLDGLG
jgi:hypothetical protein